MRFGVLGPLAVWDAAGHLVTIPGTKARVLLADLLAHDGRPVPVDRLVEDLWGERPPASPAAALQVRVSQLRRALEDAEPGGRDLVVSQPPGYRLRVGDDAVDVREFAALAARAAAAVDPRARADLCAQALALWRGEPYADVADEEFARTAVTRLAEQRLAVVELRAEARVELGEHQLLAAELADLVAQNPLRERLRAAHLRALYGAGRQSEALESYEDLRRRLADDLGLDPSRTLSALHQAILRQDPSLREAPAGHAAETRHRAGANLPAAGDRQAGAILSSGETPPEAHAATPPVARPASNLPAAVSNLVGREEAVTDLRGLLATARLVTLTGTGGVGKTTLALETARQLAEDHTDGPWLVELAGFARPGSDRAGPETGAPGPATGDDLASLVLTTLGVRQTAATGRALPAPDRLDAALRSRRMLLVLDNCEHVVDEVAWLVHRLLRAAPGLTVLATSREPLGLAAEVVWPVPPLAVPPPAGADGRGWAASPGSLLFGAAGAPEHAPGDAVRRAAAGNLPAHGPVAPPPGVAEIAAYPAVRLFAARAGAAARGFTLDERTAPGVALLCRRLDGIPLALELAATRVRTLGVDGVVARLDDRFRLLAHGLRGVPERQRTLTAVIDWSWELLTGAEQAVLRRLAAHHDGSSLTAAEAVCADDAAAESPGRGAGVAAADVLDLLGRLVDRSLVVLEAWPGEPPRYRLLESIAAYCLDRLRETGELPALRRRHASFYTELAVRAAEALRGPDQRHWLRTLDLEAANLRAALDHETVAGGVGALRLADALAWYWFLRGRLAEAARWLGAALAARDPSARDATAGDGEAAALDARVAAWHAGFALLLGEAGPADLAALAAGIDDPAGRARAEWFLAHAALERGDVASAGLAARAADRAGEAGDRWAQGAASATLAKLAHIRGEPTAVASAADQAARHFEELGDGWGMLQATDWLGGAAELAGEVERAARHGRAGLDLAIELGLWPDVCVRLGWLGWLALNTGDTATAEAHSLQALRLAAEQGFDLGTQSARMVLAFSARRAGRLDEAAALLAEQIAQARDLAVDAVNPPMQLGFLLTEQGHLCELRGDLPSARAAHAEAWRLARSLGAKRDLAGALEGLAAVEAASGNATSAARLLGAADSLRGAAGLPRTTGERADAARAAGAARAALGDDGFAAERARGADLGVAAAEDAMLEASGEPAPSRAATS